MNPDLQKQLAEMLAKLTDATTGAATWAQTQVGPLVQEKIAFGRAWETTSLLMAIALAVFLGYLCKRSWQKAKDDDYDNPCWPIAGVMTLLGVLGMFFGIADTLQSFLMVWFAPRLYIVEWLKSMVTKA